MLLEPYIKKGLDYILLHSFALKLQSHASKGLEDKIINQDGVSPDLVSQLKGLASDAISKLWNFDTNESQGLVCFELLIQQLWESVNKYADSKGSEKNWEHIVNNYWAEDGPIKEVCSELDKDARNSVKYCLETQAVGSNIIDRLEVLSGGSQPGLVASVNLIISKLREELLDAKKEWGYMNELT